MWFSRRNTVFKQPSSLVTDSPKGTNQAAVIECVKSCYQLAERQLKQVFIQPTIHFSLRGKAAGTAHPTTQHLRFNAILLEENPSIFLKEVVPHEVCHLLAYQLYGRVKPHGAEWKQLMQSLFNLPGHVTHQFDVSSVTPKGVKYHCGCGDVELSIRRHNKVVRQQAIYQCRRCGETLVKADS